MRNPALKDNLCIADYRRVVREALAPHRLEILAQSERSVRRIERWVGDHFVQGEAVNVDDIRPRLELVTTERQHDLWRYCPYLGSMPYTRGCGRLLRALSAT